MSTLHVVRGNLRFCPDCLDVFGVVGDDQKPCDCVRSAGVPLRWRGGDFPTPFHICLYCGLEVVSSGSKFSSFFYDECRVAVSTLNNSLDRTGWVSLPIGRHSLMHSHLRHARPFTTQPTVRAWARQRLQNYWEAFSGPGDDWVDFSASSQRLVTPDQSEQLAELALRLQTVPPDNFFDALTEANARMHKAKDSS
jgi:hypothetical protein